MAPAKPSIQCRTIAILSWVVGGGGRCRGSEAAAGLDQRYDGDCSLFYWCSVELDCHYYMARMYRGNLVGKFEESFPSLVKKRDS